MRHCELDSQSRSRSNYAIPESGMTEESIGVKNEP